jgi:hypothetical protein
MPMPISAMGAYANYKKNKKEKTDFENILKSLKTQKVISDRSDIIEQIDRNIKIFEQARKQSIDVGDAKEILAKLRNFNNPPICSGFKSDKKRLCDKITELLRQKDKFKEKHTGTLALREEIEKEAENTGVYLGYGRGGGRRKSRRRRTKKRRGKTTKKRRGRKSTKKKRKRKRKRTRRK